MTLHPAYDALFGKHRIRFFADKRQWKDNCLECGGKDTLFVRYDDDVAEFRCEACGRNGSERLRPPSAPPDGGNGKPRNADDDKRRLEEAQRAFDAAEQECEQNLNLSATDKLKDGIAETRERDFPEKDEAPPQQSTSANVEPEPKPPTIEEATALRRKLVAAGYLPIPLYGKEPPILGKNNPRKGFGGWQNLTRSRTR